MFEIRKSVPHIILNVPVEVDIKMTVIIISDEIDIKLTVVFVQVEVNIKLKFGGGEQLMN